MNCICLDDDDYQLITWSKDQSLRIWRVDVNLQKVSEISNFFVFLFSFISNNDDFKYLCDTNYLTLKTVGTDVLIYNTKYKFIFNHESPGHSNLYITQKWTKGINHYVMNNYEEFINRYN